MVIISKHKDYFDFLQGIYGRDEKKILDRTSFVPYPYLTDADDITLYFCGEVFVRRKEKIDENDWRWTWGYKGWKLVGESEGQYWYKTGKKECTEYTYSMKYGGKICPYPVLKDIGFDKVMSPKEAYLTIESYISYKEPEMPSDPDDVYRYEEKGFDKKKSFRK